MSLLRIFAVTAFAGLAAWTGVQAQSTMGDRLTVDASDIHAPARSRFVGGYAVDGGGLWVVEFFDTLVEGGAPTFTARRALDGLQRQEHVEVKTAQECPAIAGVLEALNNLATPQIRVANLRRAVGPLPMAQRPQGPETNAPYYTIWGRSMQADGSFAESKFSANTGPIADFARFADEQLASCWRQGSAEPG